MTTLATQPNTATVRAACYRRVSTLDQAKEDKVSLDQQRAICEQEAAKRGWTLTADYVDPGVSGEKFEERPALQQLLRDARPHKFDVVIVVNGNRIARRKDIYETVVQIVENECRIPIFDLANPLPVDPLNFDPYKDESRLINHSFRGMLAAVDQRERTRRLKAAIEAKYSQGKLLPSVAPYGYREVWESVPGGKPVRAFEVIPEQFEVVRRMAHWVLVENLSTRQISNRLREIDAPNAKGGKWVDVIVLRILANPFYGGKVAYKRNQSVARPTTRKGYGVIKNPRPETVILAGHPIEAPWTWDEWEAIQEAIIEKRQIPSRAKSSPNPLAGVLRCAHCRTVMGYAINRKTYKGETRRFPFFRCAKHSHNKYDCRPVYLPVNDTLEGIWRYLDEAEKRVKENPGLFRLELKAQQDQYELSQIEAAERSARNEFERIARQRATLDERLLDGLELSKYEALSDRLAKDEESARQALLDAEKARQGIALRQVQTGEVRDFFNEWREFRAGLDEPLEQWPAERVERVRMAFRKAIKGLYVQRLDYGGGRWKLDIVVEWQGDNGL